MNEINANQGFSITGICKGLKTTVSGQYTNHDLGIAIQVPDGFGGYTENITYVSVFGDSLERLSIQAENFKGKLVCLPVNVLAKLSKANNAYQRVLPQQGANMIEIKSQLKAAS